MCLQEEWSQVLLKQHLHREFNGIHRHGRTQRTTSLLASRLKRQKKQDLNLGKALVCLVKMLEAFNVAVERAGFVKPILNLEKGQHN